MNRLAILFFFAALLPQVALAQAAESVRPEIGKPLQAAQKLITEKKFKEALAEVVKVDAIKGLTPYEAFVTEQMRGAAASGAGDNATALKAYEAVLASGKLTPENRFRLMEAVAGTYLRDKNYAKSIEWLNKYRTEGGKNPITLNLVTQAYYLGGQYALAAKEAAAQIAATESAGGKPTEEQIKLLASAYVKQKDMAGYSSALEKMLRYHPKQEYWADAIQRTAAKPGFSDRLIIDMYRLLRATGTLEGSKDYMEMAQLAVQAVLLGEARAIVEEGYVKKVLGTGTEADRQQRLKNLIETRLVLDKKELAATDAAAAAAATGDPLIRTGLAYVTYGDAAKGLALMEQGLKKGGLKKPEEAKLRLGYAYYVAGQKDKAIQTFKTVAGKDGAADLARLWIMVCAR
ncbi:MAG: tetratricopeptide repeat protein [Pseudomonadota bacterium]